MRKEAKDKGFRTQTIQFRKILNEGFFIHFSLATSIEIDNEPQVLLWRAVIDQHLKDIISHHLVCRNFYQYYDARKFIDEQVSGKGAECDLAFLDPEKTKDLFRTIELACQSLREKGIVL